LIPKKRVRKRKLLKASDLIPRALLRVLGNLFTGHGKPELAWRWPDFVALGLLGALIVVVTGGVLSP
jgi:hypothetical protein